MMMEGGRQVPKSASVAVFFRVLMSRTTSSSSVADFDEDDEAADSSLFIDPALIICRSDGEDDIRLEIRGGVGDDGIGGAVFLVDSCLNNPPLSFTLDFAELFGVSIASWGTKLSLAGVVG